MYMTIETFEDFIIRSRAEFKERLNESVIDNGIKAFVLSLFDSCHSQFEEDTLKENLQEEFGFYLESLKKAE